MRTLDGWNVDEAAQQLHVVPVNDCAVHTHSCTCNCKPVLLEADEEDPTSSVIIVHNAFDRRQEYENTVH